MQYKTVWTKADVFSGTFFGLYTISYADDPSEI